MKWQPIKTAPKDGTEILLFGKYEGEIHLSDEGVIIGRFNVYAYPEDSPDVWIGARSDYYEVDIAPTHWAPLPSPPRKELNDTNSEEEQ